jgi:flagellar protein FliS
MTQQNDPWQSYRKVTTQTATSGHLVLMLYDGAIGFLERGLTGFEYTDPLNFNLTINNNLLRAQAIVYELNARLDMEKGGDVAANFRQLYSYYYRRLCEANMKKKKPPIQEVIRHLRVLRESWAEMLQRGPATDRDSANAAGTDLRLA